MSHSSTKAIVSALIANICIAIAKTIGAIFTASGTLLAESLHSWADCINQVLLLIGVSQSKKAPDLHHPMGYGKVSYFYSICVAFLLFFVAGLASLQHGIHVLQNPEPVQYLEISIGILLLSVALEGFALFNALKSVKEENPNQSLWFRNTRNSELLIIVAEDSGALLGLMVALIALTLTLITGNPLFDAIGTMMVGVLLIILSIAVMRELRSLIIGESVEQSKHDAIISFLEKQPEVHQVINLITQQYGQDIMVAVKIEMKEKTDALALISHIDIVEERLQQQFNIKWSFFEPDVSK
jgi:cation diffusion facilitator family transporter